MLDRIGWLTIALLATSASVLAAGGEPQSRPASAPHEDEAQVMRQAPMPHLLYLPPGYGRDGDNKRWPVVLFLHGRGESGQNLELVKTHGPPKLVSQGKQFPFILVSPQTDHGWNAAELGRLLDHIESHHAVDRSRRYVTGLSMGGFGTWSVLSAFPDRFAAAVMICGGGDPTHAARLQDTPIWLFHGDKDTVVPASRSQAIADALKAADGNVRFTVYSGVGHDSWTDTYNNPEVYQWMLAQRRSSAEPQATMPAAGVAETRPAPAAK